jgi:hypothetical protein
MSTLPSFCRVTLPGCASDGAVEIAELVIGFGPFHEKFVSRPNAPDHAGGRASTRRIEGPFAG